MTRRPTLRSRSTICDGDGEDGDVPPPLLLMIVTTCRRIE